MFQKGLLTLGVVLLFIMIWKRLSINNNSVYHFFPLFLCHCQHQLQTLLSNYYLGTLGDFFLHYPKKAVLKKREHSSHYFRIHSRTGWTKWSHFWFILSSLWVQIKQHLKGSQLGGSGLDPAVQFKGQGKPRGHIPMSLRKYLTTFPYTSSVTLFSDISI